MKEILKTFFGGKHYREKQGFWHGVLITLIVGLFLYFLPPGAGVLYLAFVHIGASSTVEIIFFMTAGILLGGGIGAFLGYLVKNYVPSFSRTDILKSDESRADPCTIEEPLLKKATKGIEPSRGIKIKDAVVYLNEEDIPDDKKAEYIQQLTEIYTTVLKPIYGNLFPMVENDTILPSKMVSEYSSFVGQYNHEERRKAFGKTLFIELTHEEYIEKFKLDLKEKNNKRHKDLRNNIPQEHIENHHKNLTT